MHEDLGGQSQANMSLQNWINSIATPKLWIVPFILSFLLIALQQYEYLMFHIFAEFFAVVISFILFAVAWQTYEFSKNFFLLFLACAYFWLGSLDLAHALTYKGMNLIVQNDSNTATQFWIATRYMEAAFLLAAPFVVFKNWNRFAVFILPGLIAITLAVFIFAGAFPTVFIEGQGLTPLKVYSEYIIIAILMAAIAALNWRKPPISDDARRRIIFAIILTIGAELSFTLYVDLYGVANIFGHIFKLCSYWVLYQATVAASLTHPYLELQAKHDELQANQNELVMLSNAINQTPVSILITDARGYILYANPKFEEVSGYSAGEVIGRHPQILRSEQTLQADYEDLWATIFAGKQWKGELKNKRKDGTLYWESLVISPVNTPDGNISHFLSISEDITERKRLESEITRFGRIVDQSFSEIYISDAKTSLFSQVNLGGRQNLGYTIEELRKLTPADIKPLYSNEELQKQLEPLRKGLVEDISFTTLHERKDGSTYDAEIRVQLLAEEDPPVFLTNIRDVTKRRRLEEQLRQAQKMEAVGQLTGGIAHDFNNILAIIQGNLELLEEIVEGNTEAAQCIEGALEGSTRGADLTSKLLGFTRKQDSKIQSTDANSVIRHMEPLIAKSLTASIEVDKVFSEALWLADFDPLDFENAVLNLALNSRDAMPAGGSLTIETANKVLDDTYVGDIPGVKEGEFILVSISDTGTGMDAETKKKALDPFFTTKEPGKGTGLGLSMVFGFVRRSGGHLTIYSEVGKGTTVQLYLPKSVQNNNAASSADTHKVVLPRGKETILVVDDEPALLQLATVHLENLGYQVRAANNPAEALKALEEHADINLLFSDIIMPGGMDGYHLASEALKKYPALRIILATGFAGKQKMGADINSEFTSFFAENLLKKPYSKAELAAAVRRALEAPEATPECSP